MVLEYIFSLFPINYSSKQKVHCLLPNNDPNAFMYPPNSGNFQAPKGNTWRHSYMLPSSTCLTYFFLLIFSWFPSTWSRNLASWMQFSDFGSLEKHGFTRNRIWSIDTNPPPFSTNSSNKASIDLILKPSKEDLKIFPHRYTSKLFHGL